jgi:hypothetical protein
VIGHPKWNSNAVAAAFALLLLIWLNANVVAALQVDTTAVVAGASLVSQHVSTQEWLGPLSAIALSPFFGVTCLSGAATYGPEWIQSRSSLIGPSSPLNNPLLFWTMLGLTVATSLPRLTKVGKPIALAAEKLEMYATVIILISMRLFSTSGELETPAVTFWMATPNEAVTLKAGLASS